MRSRGTRLALRASVAALALHAAGLGGYALYLEQQPAYPLRLVLQDVPAAPGAAGTGGLARVELLEEAPPGAPLPSVPGPGDVTAFAGEHPFPEADVELPGETAAARGGDGAGGTPRWSGRRDEEDTRAEIWNDPRRSLTPHEESGRSRSSPEALTRAPKAGFDDRTETRRRARRGEPDPQSGKASGAGEGAEREVDTRRWEHADPVFDEPGARRPARRPGATRPGRDRLLAERGERAAEARRRGPAADDRSAAAASDETDPAPFELTRESAGGEGESGIAGAARGSGVSPRARRRRGGTAASRARHARGDGGAAVRARRNNPYFRDMYRRVDRAVDYPPKLARELRQGQVVVSFELHADGRVVDLRVVKSSGFEEFDREAKRGFRRAAPFGPVPRALRGNERKLRVKAPYTFSNPMIR